MVDIALRVIVAVALAPVGLAALAGLLHLGFAWTQTLFIARYAVIADSLAFSFFVWRRSYWVAALFAYLIFSWSLRVKARAGVLDRAGAPS